jgi:hypothetical protein
MITASAAWGFSGVGSIIQWSSKPVSPMARNNCPAIGFFESSNICVSIPAIASIPISGRIWGLVAIPPRGQLIQVQPADVKASPISTARCVGSAALAADIANFVPENCFSRATNFSLSIRCLGASLFSSEIIVACCASIFDCWSLLISSSNTNKTIVHNDSTAMPPSTSHVATRWTEAEYSADSNIIPAPTANEATTLTERSQKWGQNGHDVSGSTALKYVSILAILSWLLVSLFALTQLARSLIALWYERYPKGKN